MSKKNYKISDEEFIEIVKNNYSIRACLEAQGLKPAAEVTRYSIKELKG